MRLLVDGKCRGCHDAQKSLWLHPFWRARGLGRGLPSRTGVMGARFRRWVTVLGYWPQARATGAGVRQQLQLLASLQNWSNMAGAGAVCHAESIAVSLRQARSGCDEVAAARDPQSVICGL